MLRNLYSCFNYAIVNVISLQSTFMSGMLGIKAFFWGGVDFSPVKKDMKDETDDRMQQFKKKAKELRILDSKTAQNLCKCSVFL